MIKESEWEWVKNFVHTTSMTYEELMGRITDPHPFRQPKALPPDPIQEEMPWVRQALRRE